MSSARPAARPEPRILVIEDEAEMYGFRAWALPPTLWLLAAVTLSTGTVVAANAARSAEPVGALGKVPLVAALFWVVVWHIGRKRAADAQRAEVIADNTRLLATQRRFLQDASHQLRTPITIALGHAELLARQLAGRRGDRDVAVVIDELGRLRRLSERLLLIAASDAPDFLITEPVPLEQFAVEMLARWRPAARRCWRTR